MVYTDRVSVNAFFIRADILPDGALEALPLVRRCMLAVGSINTCVKSTLGTAREPTIS